MKKIITRIALVLTLSIAIAEPVALTQQNEVVSQAKEKRYTVKQINNMIRKIEKGYEKYTKKKIKKIIGRSLGKAIYSEKNKKGVYEEYAVKFILKDEKQNDGKIITRYSEFHFFFWKGKLSDFENHVGLEKVVKS
jgi:type III secretory pathway component EscR